ncbi:MAG: sigma-70 family RNA polymerase sigma factor [candidate division KSB1 bacterium]|nr:sigma-70 family RNA polymerase sigma factor [candidate division KSB1 bacterium]MDZ7303878.1 sigma-70 family RNA polymerase sigma factor [candidate division KSB1 bacterium]MDZ7313198.1 sigma-70 family RNA polymerase sigma factor [candidate division KSB1 bacterium]
MQTDNELIARIRAGDQRAFAELIDRYKARIFHTTLRILGNREDAEEAAQDTFLRAYRGLENFREEAAFSTWIYRICVNTCLNLLESRKRFKAQEIESTPVDELPHIESPEFDFVEEDLQTRVLSVLQKLPVKYRTVLVLYHIQHLAYQEIAEITQMPIGSVKTHLFRARAMLRERLLRAIPHEELVS